MSVALDTAVSVAEIEDKLAELGYETEFYGDDDGTYFTITVGDKQVTIYDAVSGDYFRPENVVEASYTFGIMGKDLTEKFEAVESIHDFIYAVQDAMAVDFMAR